MGRGRLTIALAATGHLGHGRGRPGGAAIIHRRGTHARDLGGGRFARPPRAIALAPQREAQEIEPPVPWAQACNILYPRSLLERLDGFDEAVLVGEDTDLALRARDAGAPYVAAPEVVTYHAVHTPSLPRHLRGVWRWRDLPALVRRHPSFRAEFPLRVFWKPAHAWLPLALAGAILSRRRGALALLAAPWASQALPDYGPGLRGRLRALSELPLAAVVDATEMAALARGSVRHRPLFL